MMDPKTRHRTIQTLSFLRISKTLHVCEKLKITKLKNSKKIDKLFCFPGNAGTSGLAENIEVDILDFKKILKLIKLYN